ncbi:MAG: methionine--tRNA ligase [Alphaproteobacteria bacterium]|nr:methionine--tRNA ligase [Alphaproteobacteria bacterium]
MKKYITTPIYYINGAPHVGHAFTTILGDVLKKIDQMRGNEVFYTTGTDEHGQKNQSSCQECGLSIQDFIAQRSANFQKLFDAMNIDYDFFVHTSSSQHKDVVRDALDFIYKKGLIKKKSYEGLYCEGCEQFKKPSDLDEHGNCPDHQKAPKLITEENYFFPLEQDRQWLIDYINTHPDWIKPKRFAKEVLGMLSEPLDDLCISRPKSRVWLGVDLPFDNDFVTYIWFDALLNYISSIGWKSDGDNSAFHALWDNSTHLLAKDILKTHAVYWPIMLKALGINPPQHLIVHGYWLGEGGVKMSKSLGNVVDPYEVMNLMGIEPLRFYLCNAMSLSGDAQISLDLLKQGYKQLANNIGNLQMRVLKMIAKNLDGLVPSNASLLAEDKALLENLANTFTRIYKYGEHSLELVNELSTEILKAGDAVNAYFAANTPWILAKDESQRERYEAVIYTTLDALRLIALAVYPFMPITSEKILASLGVHDSIKAEFLPMKLPVQAQTVVGEPLFPFIG